MMKRKLIQLYFIAGITILFFGCNNTSQVENTDSHEHEHAEAKAETKKDCSNVHWSHHTGEEGPGQWKNLCDGYMSCGGQAQSPINIVTDSTASSESLSAIEVNYVSTPVDIINNGHTVQFNTTEGSSVKINDKEYNLLQFHYHALSEHTINNTHYPIEVHFVHKNSDNDYAVIGIMIEEGQENELFTSYLENFPKEKGKYTSEQVIELAKLLPTDMGYYNYSGSLTTPPCSEVVNWYVLKNPLKASVDQIQQISEILHDNYRPVMALNERPIYSY